MLFLIFLIPKFPASSHLQCLNSLVCADLFENNIVSFLVSSNIHFVFVTAVHCLDTINGAILKADKETILKMLKSQHLGIKNVKDENIDHYVVKLQETVETKMVTCDCICLYCGVSSKLSLV